MVWLDGRLDEHEPMDSISSHSHYIDDKDDHRVAVDI